MAETRKRYTPSKEATMLLKSAGSPHLNLALLMLLISGCSDELSRSKAAALITAAGGVPYSESTELPARLYKSQYGDAGLFGITATAIVGGPTYSVEKQRLDQLEAASLIRVGEVTQSQNAVHITYATVCLTPEGLKYLLKESPASYTLRTAEVIFGEVTGIRTNEQLKSAEADYTLRRVNLSPFGPQGREELLRRSASFVLYDDGWRLERMPQQEASPQQPVAEPMDRADCAAEEPSALLVLPASSVLGRWVGRGQYSGGYLVVTTDMTCEWRQGDALYKGRADIARRLSPSDRRGFSEKARAKGLIADEGPFTLYENTLACFLQIDGKEDDVQFALLEAKGTVRAWGGGDAWFEKALSP